MTSDRKEKIFMWTLVVLYLLGVFFNYNIHGLGGAIFALIVPPIAVLISFSAIGFTVFYALCYLLGMF